MARKTPRKDELIARITELRTEGKSWDDVVNIITLDGFVDASGGEYKARSLPASYSKWIKAGVTEKGEIGATTELPTDETENSMTDDAPPLSEETSPTDEDIAGMTEASETDTTDAMPDPEQTPAPSPTREGETNLTDEMRTWITEYMEAELNRILAGVEITEVQKSGRGGEKNTIKKSFSLPLDLWNEFERRFPPKKTIHSNHIAAALRAYLRLNPGRTEDSGD